MIVSSSVFLKMINVSAKFVEKIKTHLSSVTLFMENLAVFEIMWKNMVHPNRPKMTIQYNEDGIFMPDNQGKDTNTHNI